MDGRQGVEGEDGGFEMHDVRKPDLSVGPMTREFVHGPFLRPRHGYGVYPCSASATVFFFLLTITIYVGMLLGTMEIYSTRKRSTRTYCQTIYCSPLLCTC